MLNLLGVPKAILEHVIFCHQEESNWFVDNLKFFNFNIYLKILQAIERTERAESAIRRNLRGDKICESARQYQEEHQGNGATNKSDRCRDTSSRRKQAVISKCKLYLISIILYVI